MSALDTTIQAIAGLSRPTDTFKANEYLTHFESTSEAWSVAHQLLALPISDGNNYRFFGAKIFHSKIQKDLSQLQAADVANLKDMLIKSILILAAELPIDITVVRYLCLAVSALAVQLDQPGIVSEILTWCNPITSTAPVVLLELLTVLPEECFDSHIQVAYRTRESFALQLHQSSAQVFLFLEGMLTSAIINKQLNTTNQIVRCFEKWVSNTNITTTELMNCGLFGRCVELSSQGVVVEESIEFIISVSRKYECKDGKLCEQLIRHVLSLRPLWITSLAQCRHDEDYEAPRALTRLFTETCEAFLDMITSTHVDRLIQADLLTQLLECAKFPHSFEIARIPLKFFYDASLIVDHSDEDSAAVLQARFAPYFTSLVFIAVQQMLLPLAVLEGREPLSDDVKAERSDWRECIGDARVVLGCEPCLRILCGIIQEQTSGMPHLSASNWQAMEACLSAILQLGPHISPDEKEVVPQLLQFIQSVPPVLPIQLTAIKLLGKIAKWIMFNPTYLTSSFTLLTASLSAPALAAESAESISLILQNYSSRLAVEVPIEAIHNVVVELRSKNAITLGADLSILEGIASVISTFDQASCSAVLMALISPITMTLTSLLSTPDSHSSLVTGNIDRLTAIVRYTKVTYTSGEHPMATVFLKIQPLCDRTLSTLTSETACEKVCRFYKYCIRSMASHFEPFLPSMCAHLLLAFQNKQYSPLLYAASICVSEFGRQSKFEDILYQMLWKLSEVFFHKCSSLKAFEDNPDVVEEYFHLLARYAELCPRQLVTNAQLPVLVSAGITGLQLYHKNATKGILHFFERIIASRESVSKDVRPAVDQAVGTFAGELVLILFKSLVGLMPVYALHESSGSVSDVFWKLKTHYSSNVSGWISRALENFSSEIQEEAKKLWLPDVVNSFGKPRELADLLDQFHTRCMRRVPKQ